MTQARTSYIPSFHPPENLEGPALWFAFRDGHLAVMKDQVQDGEGSLPVCAELGEIGLFAETRHYLGTYNERHCFVAELAPQADLPAGVALQGLRSLFGTLDESLAVLAGRAYQIKEWDRNHRFCGRCGGPTLQREDERARVCRACRRTTYPPISPAIMALIVRGRELLLLRRKGADASRFSSLAGFVEPGEELEDTVRRETREEVGVEVDNLKYFGSQPWPFPHSLMVAFTARYAGGEVQPDGVEIEEARWFDAADLLARPNTASIGWRLINTVAGKLARGETI